MTALPYPQKHWDFLREHFPDGFHHVAEIGTWAGDWALGLVTNFKVDRLFCVDPWQGMRGVKRAHQLWIKRMESYCSPTGPVVQVKAKSMDALDLVPDELDLVYVDGDHRRVAEDLTGWWPKLRVGGLVLIHDLDLVSVKRAVFAFFGDKVHVAKIGPIGRYIKTAWVVKESE